MVVEFINLGRNNINRTVVVKDTQALHREVGKYILSKGWGMEETEDPALYAITAGWNTVGHVKIIQENSSTPPTNEQ